EEFLYGSYTARQRDRSRKFSVLMQKGEASSAELLTADFGTEHPEDLDIRSYPLLRNLMMRLEETNAYKQGDEKARFRLMNQVRGIFDGNDRLGLHPSYYAWRLLWGPADYQKSSTVAHEHIH